VNEAKSILRGNTRPSLSVEDGVAVIRAIGRSVGSCEIDNEAFAIGLGIDPSFLADRIGFRKRAIKRADQGVCDLCVDAFHDLQAIARVEAGKIDLVCVVTQNPDASVPHMAAILHERLGLPSSCMTFDLSQGCAGFTHGLTTVIACVERLGLQNALLFTCDPYSKIVDPRDRDTALIFSDAATATWIGCGGGNDVRYRLVDSDFGTSPGSAACLRVDGYLRMDGRAIVMNAAREIPASVRKLQTRNGLTQVDVDLFLLHPGSKYVVELLRRELDVDAATAPFPAANYGNTISSSIPLMLREYWGSSAAKRIIASGFGVGFSWGTCLLEQVQGGDE